MEFLNKMLAPFWKEELTEIVSETLLFNKSLDWMMYRIQTCNIDYRKVFVYYLGSATKAEDLFLGFQPFGPIETCYVVLVPNNEGWCKGYGFVVFQFRSGAVNALQNPRVWIRSHYSNCGLAINGPPHPTYYHECVNRRIRVTGLSPLTNAESLTDFFRFYGEIEDGPQGFDRDTGICSTEVVTFIYATERRPCNYRKSFMTIGRFTAFGMIQPTISQTHLP
ncbi:UBP1-associated protein 2B-like [Tasmannia lanceolata]|uniref:UBP1-associated protein 2B-like n=1 Tax=Tasmannia lanceolata TaxID=3420 RepID=UPI004062C53D